jgi:hypothetical protein
MNQKKSDSGASNSGDSIWLVPFKIVLWPFMFAGRILYDHWISYLIGRVRRDDNRVYSIRFIWYGDSVYLHPMVWGSFVLFFVTKSDVFAAGWPLLIWFIMLAVCFLTVMYNFDILKAAILGVALIAIGGIAYFSTIQLHWNPAHHLAQHIKNLDAAVTPGFYVASAYVFLLLICAEVFWAWMFNRVELDESYVYERRFMQSSSREPIFARGLKRETKDILELLILGAADIQHRTRNGYKRFKNVPGASLGLGAAIDAMLDHRRPGEVKLSRKDRDDADQARVSDAMGDMGDDIAGEDDVMDPN